MRFDDPSYLEAWRDYGEFPHIHKPITDLALDVTERGETVMDLGACTGLITRRLLDAGRRVVAVEPSAKSVHLGRAFGTWEGAGLYEGGVTEESVIDLQTLVVAEGVTAVVARRVFPEVSDYIGVDGVSTFARVLVASGVTRFIIEGRLDSSRATHPLKNVELEIAAVTASLDQLPHRPFTVERHYRTMAVVSIP